MSKRNIAYVKPQDPAFLARLKNEIGYKEGPTVETKKQKLQYDSDTDEDLVDRESEKPLVVVLKEGDLTAEEAEREEARIAKEAAEAKADLNQRIIFKKRNKDSTSKEALNCNSSASSTLNSEKGKEKSSIKIAATKKIATNIQKPGNKLSFNNEDDDEEEEE